MTWKKMVAIGGVLLAVLIILTVAFNGRYGDSLPDAAIQNDDLGAKYWNTLSEEDVVARIPAAELAALDSQVKDGALYLSAGETVELTASIPSDGVYKIAFEYAVAGDTLADCVLSVQTAASSYNAALPVIWTDAPGEYPLDRYGNEVNKEQIKTASMVRSLLTDRNTLGADALQVPLTKGENRLLLRLESQDLQIQNIFILSEQSEIAAWKSPEGQTNGQLVVIEAQNYSLKSDSFIRAKNENNVVCSPYTTYSNKMNVLSGDSWNTAGQKVLWTFEIPESGVYELSFRYSQYEEVNKHSFRDIEIDGSVPFDAFKAVAFAPTGSNEYRNYTVTGTEGPVSLYLEKGIHTIAMTAVNGPMESVYQDLLAVMSDLSDIGTQLNKLTAGVNDENRTWDIEAYMPGLPERLLDNADKLDALYARLKEIANDGQPGSKEPSYASDLTYASKSLRKLCKDPRTLPNKEDLISEGDASACSSIGNVLQKLVSQPLSIDRIYFSSGKSLPSDKVNVFTQAAESVKKFFYSFLPGAGSSGYAVEGNSTRDSKELQVWVNMSVQNTEILQQLVNESYNTKYQANVQLSVVSDPQKLILSNAAKTNPDVVLGLNYYMPYDLAIRGAAKNLLEYEDFLDIYLQDYNAAGLSPLCYDGGIYGAVDSVNFQVLFYRKDILNSLGLSVPDTWDDVVEMMPELLRHKMNFNIPLANSIGFKSFNVTGPFLYQNGGQFYAKDGLSSAFNDKNTMNGFTQMTDLFRSYGIQSYVANFYNSFRYGGVPIGIGGFDTYMRLQVAAPELKGQWGIALVPGVRDEESGEVLRYQAADSTSSMIFNNTKKSDEAWQFFKWWLSTDTQVRFSSMLENRYGKEYRWNTANRTAFTQLSYPEEDKTVILEQLQWQKETIRHPAGYMVERESSNIWNNVIANDKTLNSSIDHAKTASDREILRKLKEFGFIDDEGNVIKEYPTDAIEAILQSREGGE